MFSVLLAGRSTLPLGKHLMTAHHDRSVRQVASGYVNGVAADSFTNDQMVQKDAFLAEKTRIVDKSPEFRIPPIAVSRQIELRWP